MLKLVGVLLLTGGAFGFAMCLCQEQKRRLSLLKEMKYMYELLQNEISYTGLPLPEIFLSVSLRVKDPFDRILHSVGKSMDWEQGWELAAIWEKEAGEELMKTPLTRQQRQLLLRFPECTGLADCRGQAKALGRSIEELDKWIRQMEEDEKNKTRLIMSLGTAGGLLLSILLL